MTAELFPDLPADEVLAATAARWDTDGPLPVPRPGWLACPVCRCELVQPRYWRFHLRDGATVAARCDVSVKCTACAAVWIHGVALDAKTHGRMVRLTGGRRRGRDAHIGWREARQLLAAHGAGA